MLRQKQEEEKIQAWGSCLRHGVGLKYLRTLCVDRSTFQTEEIWIFIRISSISHCFSWVTCNIFSHWKSFNQRQLLLYHPTLTAFVRFLHSGLRQSQREDAAASKAEGRRGLPIEAGERNTTGLTKLRNEMFEGHVLQKCRALNSSDEMMCVFLERIPQKNQNTLLDFGKFKLGFDSLCISPIFFKRPNIHQSTSLFPFGKSPTERLVTAAWNCGLRQLGTLWLMRKPSAWQRCKTTKKRE